MAVFGACRFCNIVSGRYQHVGVDQPFEISDDFIAVASIGAFIEGWSLIVPKEHQLSMLKVYKDKKFEEFASSVIARLSIKYGSLIAFEHGSNKEGSITACGTDHAHLHLVPYKISLLSNLQASNLQWDYCKASEIEDKVGNKEYLFYSDLGLEQSWKSRRGYLHVLTNPISQFFRNLLADMDGLPERADYKMFPYLERSQQTRKALVGIDI
ncbi:MAG: hypothetical protein V1747_04075 [Candidatus Omnitrophota bacterium]